MAALVGLVLLGAVVGTAGNALVRRLSNPVGKYRLLYAGVLFPVTLLSYGLLELLGFGPALVGDVPVAPDALDAIVSDFVELLAAGPVWFAAYTPTVRGVREVRDIDLSTRGALAKMARYVLGLSAIAA